jgi:hypothetical protein
VCRRSHLVAWDGPNGQTRRHESIRAVLRRQSVVMDLCPAEISARSSGLSLSDAAPHPDADAHHSDIDSHVNGGLRDATEL